VVAGVVLQDACSWREVQPRLLTATSHARITTGWYIGFTREFLGFNRARHTVLEAAILATRIRFLPLEQILSEFERLQVIVEKTAGAQEREAMQILTDYVYAALEVR
jgi:hypothetical protein